MTESFSKNFIDYEEYPQSANIQNRCVSMIGSLFHAPAAENGDTGAVGTSCVGSSEAIMLAVLAMRKRWKNKRLEAGLPADKPNIVMSSGRWASSGNGKTALLTIGRSQLFRSAGRRRRGTSRSRRSWCTARRIDTSLTPSRPWILLTRTRSGSALSWEPLTLVWLRRRPLTNGRV